MSAANECERCLGRVKQRGDHMCTACCEALGRTPDQPFWGQFANHPDARLRFDPRGEMSRARDFVGVLDGLLGSKAA